MIMATIVLRIIKISTRFGMILAFWTLIRPCGRH